MAAASRVLAALERTESADAVRYMPHARKAQQDQPGSTYYPICSTALARVGEPAPRGSWFWSLFYANPTPALDAKVITEPLDRRPRSEVSS